jgi:hypothetical protein
MKKKSKPAAKSEPAKTATRTKKAAKVANPAEMRQSIATMVELEMKSIGHAVVEEAKKGQLATVKYLFEVSGVYPAATEPSQAKPEEGETLARLLLTRLGLPLEPAISPDDEAPPRNPPSAGQRMVKAKDGDSAENPPAETGAKAEREADECGSASAAVVDTLE